MSAKQEQISGDVYVVFCGHRIKCGNNYEYEKEIEFIIDNENKAKEMVQDFNDTFGKDSNVNYYYEKWEVLHHE